MLLLHTGYYSLTVLLLGAVYGQACGTCQSFGTDFQNGGTYFQNNLSDKPFTAVQEFEGCANDTSHNILVDPRGGQYECSQTPLAPDDNAETITCPLKKCEMWSGSWSLLIISNNGDCAPIAYQRQFSLSVGPQSTKTVAPSLTIVTTQTPVVNVTTTTTVVVTSTADPQTTTVPAVTVDPPLTIHPLPKVVVVEHAVFTITKTKTELQVTYTATQTTTGSCTPTDRPLEAMAFAAVAGAQRRPDPTARILATILSSSSKPDKILEAQALAGLSHRDRRGVPCAVEATAKLTRRAPDAPTVTSTDGNLRVQTMTRTRTASTLTATVVSTKLKTMSSTPVVTKKVGVSFAPTVVTAPQNTLTLTSWYPLAEETTTLVERTVLTVTETVGC